MDAATKAKIKSVTPVLLITGAVLIWLFFLHRSSEGSPGAAATIQMQRLEERIGELQTRLDELPAAPPGPSQAGADAKTALKQQQDLIAAELKLTEDQIKEAVDAEKRTREAGTAFLGVFAILAAIILGQGYLNLFELEKRSQSKLDELTERGTQIKQDSDTQLEKINTGLETIGKAKDVALQIDQVWTKISEKELPVFLEESDKILGKEVDLRESEQLAVMDEIDTFTYLYPHFRFGKRSERQTRHYLAALLQSVRGLIVKRNYRHALRRLKELLRPEHLLLLDHLQLAKAHSYQAYTHYLLIKGFLEEPSWVLATKLDSIESSRMQALKSLEAAEQYDPGWKFTIFVRAQLYGCLPHPAERLGTPQGSADQTEGHRKAAEEYRKLLPEITLGQRYVVLQNLACELKLVAAKTGHVADWNNFTDTLEAFPDQKKLLEEFEICRSADLERHQLRYVWQSIMADSELFADCGKLDALRVKSFWTNLLNRKMEPQQWRLDLGIIQERDASAKSWAVNLLEPALTTSQSAGSTKT